MRWSMMIIPALVVAAWIFSLLTVVGPVPDPVSDSTWEKAEAVLEKNNAEREMIIVHPVWEDGALSRFKNNFLILGEPNVPSYRHYPRIWLMLAHGADRPAYLDDRVRDVYADLGELSLSRYVRPDSGEILYDFFVHIEDASVTIENRFSKKSCKEFRLMRWWCPKKDWNHVGQRPVVIQGQWESCIWMHPLDSYRTRANYKNVKLGRRIVGEYALTDEAAEFKDGKPVDFSVFIDRERVGFYKTRKVKGFLTFEIDTTQSRGETADIAFESWSKKAGMRHFCWRAQVRDDAPGNPRAGAPDPPTKIEPEKGKRKAR